MLILTLEFRVYLSLIPQVIDERLESFAIAIKEYGLVDLLEFVHPREHLLKRRVWCRTQDLLAYHEVMRTSHIQSNYIAVELVLFLNETLLVFPSILLCLNFIDSLLQFLLGHFVLLRYLEVVVLYHLVESLEFCHLIEKELFDLIRLVAETFLN